MIHTLKCGLLEDEWVTKAKVILVTMSIKEGHQLRVTNLISKDENIGGGGCIFVM